MEININIEGYNVNGICVACLNYNRRMFYHKDVKDCFKILGNIDVPDGLTVQVCWECLARMRSALEFRSQITKAFNCLMNYSRKHTFLDSPSDLSSSAVQRLSLFTCYNMSFGEENDVKDEMSTEIKVENDDDGNVMIGDDVSDSIAKQEDDGFLLEELNDYPEGLPSAPEDQSSDEDVQLSKLRTLKEKGKKSKRKKRGRPKKEDETACAKESSRGRRRGLPEGVSPHTMSESEMAAVRAADAVSPEFLALRHRCGDCLMGFQTRKQMEYHLAGKHVQKSENIYQCDVCKAYFLSKESVASHRNLHLSAYRCNKCEFTTSMKRIIVQHLASEHGAAAMHACNECGKEFSAHEASVESHIIIESGLQDPLDTRRTVNAITKSKLNYHKVQCSRERPQCDCCGKVFANKMTLRHHLKQTQVPPNQNPKAKLYIPCKGCDKVFYSRKSYRAHVVIHDGLTYPCPICGKLFQWKRNLSRHTRNHREREAGATHHCRECRKTFASRDCYKNHMRLSKRHVGESAYSHACQYCGKKFPTKWCLVDHVDWEHLKRIKYQCSVCFKAFKTAKIMVAHMNNIHEGRSKKEPDGEHLCDVCGKSYKTVKRLKGHVWAMHTNRSATKSFKCGLCPATFTWQTSIYKHMKMMHDNNKRKQVRGPAKKAESYGGAQYFAGGVQLAMAAPAPLGLVHTL